MLPTSQQDTIVAVSTPPGRGGIGIVRLSGPRSRIIAAPLLRLHQPLAHARARFGHLLDPSAGRHNDVLDEVIATFFAEPNSYTSEDLLEIASHGSPVVLDHILRECMARGARLAEPGEFTQRAFLTGRLDLTQAEAVHDLIESTTLHQARLAASQMGGSLSREIAPLKEQLIRLIATLEAGIDFAEDDIDLLTVDDITRQIEAVRTPLGRLEHSFSHGRLVREGFSLAIVGRPNAGKSSLFNALLQQNRAIVTAHPGTTRDLVRERLSLSGIAVELIDTAGIRSPAPAAGDLSGSRFDEAETLGIGKSREAMAEADLILLVVDASLPLHKDDLAILTDNVDRPLLIALNKCDLLSGESLSPTGQGSGTTTHQLPEETYGLHRSILAALEDRQLAKVPPIRKTSSLTNVGLSELREGIYSMLTITSSGHDAALLTNLRQHDSVARAVAALDDAEGAAQRGIPHEMLIIHLQTALEFLDKLTGTSTSEDILKLIFSTFCIGK